jgi:hypothetical protein
VSKPRKLEHISTVRLSAGTESLETKFHRRPDNSMQRQDVKISVLFHSVGTTVRRYLIFHNARKITSIGETTTTVTFSFFIILRPLP